MELHFQVTETADNQNQDLDNNSIVDEPDQTYLNLNVASAV